VVVAAFAQFEVEPFGGGGLHHAGRISETRLGLKPGHHGFGGGFVSLKAASVGHHLEELAELLGGGLQGGATGGRRRLVGDGRIAAAEPAAVAEGDQGLLEIGDVRPLGTGAEGGLDLAKHGGPGSTFSS
jgi:hypothetical protein